MAVVELGDPNKPSPMKSRLWSKKCSAWQTLLSFRTTLSIQIKFTCLAVIVSYCLSYFDRTYYVMSILPGEFLPPTFWIWPLFTYNYIETRLWLVVSDIVVLMVYGRFIHPLWGNVEMLRFYALISFTVATLTCFTCFLLFYITNNVDFLFNSYIHGLAGYLAACIIAVKQIFPEARLLPAPLLHCVPPFMRSVADLKCKDLPVISFLIVTCLWLVGAVHPLYLMMYWWGQYTAWVYLRFYQTHPKGFRGDHSSDFSFASLFPHRVQPCVEILSNPIYSVLVFAQLCPRFESSAESSSPSASSSITVTLHGTEDSRPGSAADESSVASSMTTSMATKHWHRAKSSSSEDTDPSSNDEGSFVLVELEDANSLLGGTGASNAFIGTGSGTNGSGNGSGTNGAGNGSNGSGNGGDGTIRSKKMSDSSESPAVVPHNVNSSVAPTGSKDKGLVRSGLNTNNSDVSRRTGADVVQTYDI